MIMFCHVSGPEEFDGGFIFNISVKSIVQHSTLMSSMWNIKSMLLDQFILYFCNSSGLSVKHISNIFRHLIVQDIGTLHSILSLILSWIGIIFHYWNVFSMQSVMFFYYKS